jgi:hypothetical protein
MPDKPLDFDNLDWFQTKVKGEKGEKIPYYSTLVLHPDDETDAYLCEVAHVAYYKKGYDPVRWAWAIRQKGVRGEENSMEDAIAAVTAKLQELIEGRKVRKHRVVDAAPMNRRRAVYNPPGRR